MIVVRCLGHIGTSVGAREVRLEADDIDASEVVEELRKRSGKEDPGFNVYNTLVLVEEGEAFVPAGAGRRVRDGQRVALIPVSHGG